MKKFFSNLRKNTGFTLIELLVVIGILGVLAAALIATIDPFEQIKKAQDANAKNAAVEYVGAAVRYYSTHNEMMWDTPPAAYPNCATTNTTLNSTDDCLDILIADGELKAEFVNSNVLTHIRRIGGTNAVTACFNPVSKSQINDPLTQYDSTGAVAGGCPGTSTCYWCAK